MAQFLAPLINEQQMDANGDPLSGGFIEVYLAGSSTPAATTSDKAGAVPNTWPMVLNTLGVNTQGAVWVTGGALYKFIIKNAANVTQRTIDNIAGINDTTVAIDQWIPYQGTPTYVSPTSFTVGGDQTQTFVFGTRIRTTNAGGIFTGTVVRSAYSAPNTAVTVILDSGVLDAGLSLVSVGLITPTNPSLPGTLTTPPFRNRIINGALRIDQRNSGASQAIPMSTTTYTADRFYILCAGAAVASQRVAGTGYQYAQTITGAASVTGVIWGHRVESNNCWDWANKQVNVQIPISAVGITSVNWAAYVADVTDNFSAKTLIASGTLALTGAVETKFFSFPAGANAGRGVAIEFVTGALTAGQSITYQGAFQAEAGQISTFEYVEMGEELRRCQRYYSIIPASWRASMPNALGIGAYGVTWPAMRVVPTAIPANGTGFLAANVSADNLSPNTAQGGRWELTTGAANTDSYVLNRLWHLSAEL